MKKYKKGIFPLSADPITYGHLEIMLIALEQCNELLVLIANNDEKLSQYTFSLEERFNMTKKAVSDYGIKGVQVIHSSGLLTDIFMRENCDVVFRGIRHHNDIEAEKSLAELYAHIYRPIAGKMILIETPDQYRGVSSSWIKHFVRLGVNVSSYVPLFIKEALEKRINNQIKIGITGELAVGKSYVASQLVQLFKKQGKQAHHIVMDELLHQLYQEQSPGAQVVRDSLAQRFGQQVLSDNRTHVDRVALAQQLFSSEATPEDITYAQQLVYPHVERLYREATYEKEGIVLIEWAQFVEMDMLSWVNNNIILVSTHQQKEFAAKRGLSEEYSVGASRFQLSSEEKRYEIQEEIKRSHHGQLFEYTNDFSETSNFSALADQILQ